MDNSILSSPGVRDAWLGHPFVARHLELAENPAELLDAVLGTMHRVEERFPGVPFAEILAGGREQLTDDEVREALNEAGVPERQIRQVVSKRFAGFKEEAELADEELSVGQMIRKGINRTRAFQVASLHRPLTNGERVLALRAVDGEEPMRALARETGKSMNTVKWAAYRLLYERRRVAEEST